jgi:hypothetical protein
LDSGDLPLDVELVAEESSNTNMPELYQASLELFLL